MSASRSVAVRFRLRAESAALSAVKGCRSSDLHPFLFPQLLPDGGPATWRQVAGPPSGSNWGKRKGCRSEDLHPFTALSAADSALSRNLTATDREALIEEHLEFVEGPAFQEHVPVGTHMLDGLTIGFIDSDADSDAVDA